MYIDTHYLLYRLEEIGFFTYILPLAAVFLLFYFVLRKTGLFGRKRIQVGVSAVLSLVVVNYTPFRTGQFGVYISNLAGAVAVFSVILMGFFLVESLLLGGKSKEVLKQHSGKIAAVIGVSLLLLFLIQGGLSLLTGRGYLSDIDFIVSRYELLSLAITGALIAFLVSRLGGN